MTIKTATAEAKYAQTAAEAEAAAIAATVAAWAAIPVPATAAQSAVAAAADRAAWADLIAQAATAAQAFAQAATVAEAAAVVAAAPHVTAAAVVTKEMWGCDPAARESLIKEESRHRIAAYDAKDAMRKHVLKAATVAMDTAAVSITQAWDAMPFAALKAAVGALCRGGTSAPAHPGAAALYHRIGGWRTLDGDVSGGPSYDD